jgi:tRNA/tmRNA/rRNA uracil-C5-methylase (TrmA/RlmC/RlmD family)
MTATKALPVGTTMELDIGPIAHGGHCVARHDGRVIFVRHSLPGERVRARITSDNGKAFALAEAIEILQPSADRVQPPCRFSGAGGCGGCDWQHAEPAAIRRGKAGVVREQLLRLGGLSAEQLDKLGLTEDASAEELPGGPLGWRTRMRYAVDDEGRAGFHPHRSGTVLPIDDCLIATDAVRGIDVLGRTHPGLAGVDVVVSSAGDQAVVVRPHANVRADPAKWPEEIAVLDGGAHPAAARRGHNRVREDAAGRRWLVHADGFWQVHPAAATALSDAVIAEVDPRPGQTALDLYCGVGLFAGALGVQVGRHGKVFAVESDRPAADNARRNLRDVPAVVVSTGGVGGWLRKNPIDKLDAVVLDPPRTGAGAAVCRQIAALNPPAICYVACDPAALARDARVLSGKGYALTSLRVFDAFPMTHHIECVAAFRPC